MSSPDHPNSATLRCPVCRVAYPPKMQLCPAHQTPLQSGLTDPLIGRSIGGRFRVDVQIGEGGNGHVYRGVQLGVDRPIAIKVMLPHAATDGSAEHRFETEARILGQLRHPHTLRLIDHGRLEDDRPWIVTPFLAGQTLQDRLKRGPLTVEALLTVLQQVTSALEEAHAAGVVHRDLKPANLFLEEIQGRTFVRLFDFGIAQRDEDVRVTAEGQAIGTATYMSPEQIRGEKVDPRSDLYSLGVVAYECLAGRAPFEGPNRISVIMQHLSDAPEPLNVDAGIADLVAWCLEKRASDRPPDATAVLEVLDELLAPMTSGTGPIPAEPATSTQRHVQQRWLLTGLALGIALMGALIGWTMQPSASDDDPSGGPAQATVSQGLGTPAAPVAPTADASAGDAPDAPSDANVPTPTPDAGRRTQTDAEPAPRAAPTIATPKTKPVVPTRAARKARRKPRTQPAAKVPSAPRPPEGLF